MKLRIQPGLRPALQRAKGRFIVTSGKFGPIAQKWHGPNGPAKSPFDRMRQLEFAVIAKWAAAPFDLDLFTAVEMAKGTQYVPRDILMMAAYGRYYDVRGQNGEEYMPARDARPDINYMLDSITSTYGSMIFRDTGGWNDIPIGVNGQVLTLKGNLPTWEWPTGGAGSAQAYPAYYPTALVANAPPAASIGHAWKPVKPISLYKLGTIITGLAGQTCNMSLWRLNVNTLDALLYQGPSFPATTTGDNYYEMIMPTRIDVAERTDIAVILTRTDGSSTDYPRAFRSNSAPAGAFNLRTGGSVSIASKAPAVGNVMTTASNFPAFWWMGQL